MIMYHVNTGWASLPTAVCVCVCVCVWLAGDVLGPSVNGLDKLIKMPYGCGEQNMLNFAPNIYIMNYLEMAGRATADIVDKSQRYMMAGWLCRHSIHSPLLRFICCL